MKAAIATLVVVAVVGMAGSFVYAQVVTPILAIAATLNGAK
jgi:hypothetical protein